MANIHASQVSQIATLLGQGKSIEEIAGTVGLDIGDVQTVLSGASRSYVGTLEGGGEASVTPSYVVATKYEFPAEVALVGTTNNAPHVRSDIGAAGKLVTIPAGTIFLPNISAELSGAPDPANGALPLNMEVDLVAVPSNGAWEDDFAGAVGTDTPTTLVGYGLGAPTPPDTYRRANGTTLYPAQYPQDIDLLIQYLNYAADHTTIVAGSKMRNLRVDVTTITAVAA